MYLTGGNANIRKKGLPRSMAQTNGFLAIDLAADLAKMTQTITDLAAASPDSAAKATTSSYTSTLPTSPLLRVIFLDIDGVLNRTKEATHIRIDEDCVQRLKTLIEHTDAKVVLSTFWRHFDEYITYILHREGIAADVVIGRTPGRTGSQHLSASAADEAQYASRAAEIKTWLAQHPEVTQFVILDDRPSAADASLQAHFVQTLSDHGLTDADVVRCSELLLNAH
jgi:hypothetical protein